MTTEPRYVIYQAIDDRVTKVFFEGETFTKEEVIRITGWFNPKTQAGLFELLDTEAPPWVVNPDLYEIYIEYTDKRICPIYKRLMNFWPA